MAEVWGIARGAPSLNHVRLSESARLLAYAYAWRAAQHGRQSEGVIEMVWNIVAVLLVLVGIAGTILPALPGLPLVFAGLLLAAWADGFVHVSGWTMLVLALVAAIAMAADFVASLFGTKVAGASKWAMVGAGVGTLVGIFFGLPGLLLGPFVGAMAAELIYRENLGLATKAGLGAWLGIALGAAAKVAAQE